MPSLSAASSPVTPAHLAIPVSPFDSPVLPVLDVCLEPFSSSIPDDLLPVSSSSYPFSFETDFSSFANDDWASDELSSLNRFILGQRDLDYELLYADLDYATLLELPEPMRSFYSLSQTSGGQTMHRYPDLAASS